MHQIESISSREILNPFLILPPEILAMIVQIVDDNVVNTVSMMLVLDSGMKECLSLAVPYVREMLAVSPRMMGMFTGIKHLIIQSTEYVSLDMFSTNIWKNMESLRINHPKCSNLDIEEYLAPTVRITDSNMLSEDCFSDIFSKDTVQQHTMSNLRSLEIYDDTGDYPRLGLDALSSCLEILKLDGCCPNNIEVFHRLRVLSLTNSYHFPEYIKRLNTLNIEELCLACTEGDGVHFEGLNIPSLRKLKLSNSDMDYNTLVSTLNRHSLVELLVCCWDSFIDSNFDGSDDLEEYIEYQSLKIPSLRKLETRGMYIRMDDVMKNLVSLKISYTREKRLECLHVPSLEDLTINNTVGIHVGNMPSLKKLRIIKSNTITFERLENLTSLYISNKTGQCIQIGRELYPALKVLKVEGNSKNVEISIEHTSKTKISISE